ncbi:MAG: hypothetical protein H6862_03935 [Rhodospirillales bacterium]|nr:hypothetical protein [Rhodospirillales bacterium]
MTDLSSHEPSPRTRVWNRDLWSAHTVCSFEISMGNRWQEGTYLASQIEWANRHFKRCFIHLGDTLHRHNLLDRMSPEEAHATSRVMGSAWLARNAEILETIKIPHEIVRWDHWLTHPDFPGLRAAIQDHYDSNVFFRGVVAQDVERFTKRNSAVNPVRCVDYLLEEAAGDTLFCRQNPMARIYPASELATYAYLSHTQVPDHLKGLHQSVRVRVSFHRRKEHGSIPQSSNTDSGEERSGRSGA